MDIKYKNPPIREVLCAFKFEKDTPWNPIMLGLIYNKLEGTFPKTRESRNVNVNLSVSYESLTQEIRSLDQMDFLNTNENAFVKVSSNLLEIHHLKPYPSWEKYLPLIKEAFKAYIDIVKPKDIQRLELRYINQIEIEGEKLKIDEFFNISPKIESGDLEDNKSFIVGILKQYDQENSNDFLKILLTSSEEKDNKNYFYLDLDYYLVKSKKNLSKEDALNWIENAHDRVVKAFENCIKDPLRRDFEIIECQ